MENEFRRMSRKDLVQIISQLREKNESLEDQLDAVKEQLEDKRLHMENVGSIAEAVLSINGVLEAAQAAADQYLEEVHAMNASSEKKAEDIVNNAQRQAEDIVDKAQHQADTVIRKAEEEAGRTKVQTEKECADLRRQTEVYCSNVQGKIMQVLKEHEELKTLITSFGKTMKN
ncbi:MAG: hypothetical protein HUJ69_07050 [Lachnospiraceae bacterium]|nr:hypothetical protein [Lachnospiraceae bacterium]